jgi:flagellar export protein FliJ
MRRTETLDTIRTLAGNAEAESSRALAERRRTLQTEEQRLEQLRAYLGEYGAMAAGGDGIFIHTVRTRRQFVDRLQAGLEQQERVVAGLRKQIDQDTARWREARTRSLALERFNERLEDQLALRQARKEQADLDEVGQKMFRHTR